VLGVHPFNMHSLFQIFIIFDLYLPTTDNHIPAHIPVHHIETHTYLHTHTCPSQTITHIPGHTYLPTTDNHIYLHTYLSTTDNHTHTCTHNWPFFGQYCGQRLRCCHHSKATARVDLSDKC